MSENVVSVDAKTVEQTVTLSCLRRGQDTKAARLLTQLVGGQPPSATTVDRLFDALGTAPSERARLLAAARYYARQAIEAARAKRIATVPYFDAGYPALLRLIPDPPVVLWTVGDLTGAAAAPAAAIVGSRAASPAGLEVARRLASDLAEAGLTIVSGMARGVDAAAHRGSLDAGGKTIAVLGCGVDVIYPPEHAELAERVRNSGAVVSELLPGTVPLPYNFPLRNRIISGLSTAVIVIEASEKSGSLITARAALEQNRNVLAVPGSVASGRSRGCHALIKDGARLVETVEDVLQELGWTVPRMAVKPDKSLQISDLEGEMALGEPYSVDDLAIRTGRLTSAILAELGALELAGRVQRIPGGRFVRLDGPVIDR